MRRCEITIDQRHDPSQTRYLELHHFPSYTLIQTVEVALNRSTQPRQACATPHTRHKHS